MSDVTQILQAIENGDSKATDELLPLVYDELRRIAQVKMDQERSGQTLQATALVHEAYLRLVGGEDPKWNSRGHFFSAAAEAMRRILIDRARRNKREKHGGNLVRVPLEEIDVALETSDEQLLEVNDALEKFSTIDPVCAELVKLRFFCGVSSLEAAEIVGMSERSARRAWAYARSWLFDEIRRTTTEQNKSS